MRLCLDSSEMLYKLESDFCILVLDSGENVTIADAMKYLAMEIKILPESGTEAEKPEEDENMSEDENEEPKPDPEDDPNLPKSLCQDCLEKLQSAYEFKFRCEENRKFLRNYLKECANTKLAEERAVKEAALAALDIDLDNLDDLPDKLVLKEIKKEKKPRKPRDPSKPPIVRRRRLPEKNVIIAEDSQVDSAAYVRKLVTTPEQSPEQKSSNKRKSRHVIIEDILVGDRAAKKAESKVAKEKELKAKENKDKNETTEVSTEPETEKVKPRKQEKKAVHADDEPIFEDDDDLQEPEVQRPKRLKK